MADEIARAAASNATVLIRGESGVGKELVARAVHDSSPRRDHVFVCLNCAALSAELLASELFGHERGAFTGATERKIGKFEAAHKGTLMLDEIGEMSPGIQAKFLRVLEGHPFERVGGSKPDHRRRPRHRRHQSRPGEGRGRRASSAATSTSACACWRSSCPPCGNGPRTSPCWPTTSCTSTTPRPAGRSAASPPTPRSSCCNYLWPGNIRELKNVIERAVVLCRGQEIDQEDLLLTKLATAGDTADAAAPDEEFLPASLADIERRYILATLNHTGWNKSRTSNILGIERSTLDRKIRRYALDEEAGRIH